MTIRILLADDQYLIQEGIKSILRDEVEIEIVGTAKNGMEAIALAEKLEPNIVLLDIEMPEINGIEVAKYICQLLPDTKIIMLSSHNNQEYITQALEVGASSYLLKDSFVEDLKQAIYSLSRGYSYIEARLLNQALEANKANNIVNSQNKGHKIKKSREEIYTPATQFLDIEHSTANSPKNNRSTEGITRDNLAPIFDLTTSDDINTADELFASLSKISASSTRETYGRKIYFKKLILFLLAIASLIISIIIFQ